MENIDMNNINFETDKSGFLRNPEHWNQEFATYIAEHENIYLSENHWEVINYIRKQYIENNKVPELRKLLTAFKKEYGIHKSTRKYIYHLFPYGYAQQACKIAGMRQIKNWSTG
jgi:tRNA 2-thiouridine synthesizing protein E|tara:strand:- start:7634 stop:7975 length:342 start_codon:yes stop_codon:yes gene_type:complete